MLGITISERTISRIVQSVAHPPSQRWKTFLHNHLGQLVSIDFFTVPTVTMKVLFGFIVLEHRRREVLHFNVTEHPTAAWTSQQIVEAFADRETPRYLVRDRDAVYGNEVRLRMASLHIEEVLTAPRSPWQNLYAERLIGSIRRDCLNHFVILNARHLKKTLASYFAYYHESRTHLRLDKQCPFPRGVSSMGKILEIPLLAACIIAMNALRRSDMLAVAFFGDPQVHHRSTSAPITGVIRPIKSGPTVEAAVGLRAGCFPLYPRRLARDTASKR